MGKRIFISYQRADEAKVAQLRDQLRLLHHDVWIDNDGLQAGQAWWDQILKGIREVDVVVLALAPGYLESEACRAEWSYAFAINRVVIPMAIVAIDYDRLPVEIRRLEVVREGWFGKLMAAVESSSPKPLPDPLPLDPPPPLTWHMIREIVASQEGVDRGTQLEITARLIDNIHHPTDDTPEDVRQIADGFRNHDHLEARTRRLLDAALVAPRQIWLPIVGALCAGLALTHLFWVTGLYGYANRLLGQAKGPIALNALFALAGAILCIVALRARVRTAWLGLTLCVAGVIATLADAIKIGWI